MTTDTSATLSWNASSDNVGVTGYRLSVGGAVTGTSTATSYLFSGLMCGTSYTLGIAAVDAAGNVSATATLVVQTTACAAPASQPPPPPQSCAGRTFYVDYASGSDANAGTKAAPWKRAPGMVGFAGAYSHQAHDCFFFKGGVTWPNAALPLRPAAGGDATANDYYGVDRSWYAGSSWSRPVFDAGNAYTNEANVNFMIDGRAASYLTFDDLELTGFKGTAWPGGYGSCDIISIYGQGHDRFAHLYVHGWAIADTSCDGYGIFAQTYAPFSNGSVVNESVFDGSSPARQYGGSVTGIATVQNSVFREMDGMLYPMGDATIAGNLLDGCRAPTGATGHHFDAIQTNSAGPYTFSVHDNVIANTEADSVHGNECEAMFLGGVGTGGEVDNVWNNVLYALGGNGIAFDYDSTINAWNNSTVGGQTGYCFGHGHGGTHPHVYIENNYCIGSAMSQGFTSSDQKIDHNVLQASASGYQSGAPWWSPTSASAAGVGQGVNVSGSCTGALSSLCSDTSYAVGVSADHRVVLGQRTPLSRPASGAWDIGAYQWGG